MQVYQIVYFPNFELPDTKCLCAFNKVITLYKVEMPKSEMEFVNQSALLILKIFHQYIPPCVSVNLKETEDLMPSKLNFDSGKNQFVAAA